MRRSFVLGVKQMGFALPRDFILPSLSQLSIVILVEWIIAWIFCEFFDIDCIIMLIGFVMFFLFSPLS